MSNQIKVGRPTKDDDHKRTEIVRLAFTKPEFDRLKLQCASSGISKISDLFRCIILNRSGSINCSGLQWDEIKCTLVSFNTLSANINVLTLLVKDIYQSHWLKNLAVKDENQDKIIGVARNLVIIHDELKKSKELLCNVEKLLIEQVVRNEQ